jgi:mono/diheme cytochrome c family protein
MRASILFGAAALLLNGPVLAQAPEDPLPAGPGKDVVVRVCTACHGADQFAFARYTPEGWDNEISKMQSAGADMSSEDQVAISAYLARNFGKAPPAASEAPTKRDDR